MRISRNDKIFSLLNVYLPYKYDLNLDKFNDYLAKLYVHIAEMSSTCITTVGYFNPSIASVAFEGYIYVWGTLRTGLYLSVDIMLFVWTCCSRNGQGQIYI